MNDNGDTPISRADPFGRGLAAHRDKMLRSDCPFPPHFDEARRWTAGWDHAAFRSIETTAVAGRIGRSERAWSREEVVVLIALANSGERLGSLASRLGRSRVAIREECARRDVTMTADQLNG